MSLIAPRPSPGAQASSPVIVVGALRTASGLGQSARLCHDALKAAGFDVYGVDLTATLRQPRDCPNFAFADGSALLGRGTIVMHVNGPFVPLAMLRLGRRLVRNKRIVGYWAWELPRLPADWRRGVPLVHEIWVPSRFTADAVRSVTSEHPISILPHPSVPASTRTGSDLSRRNQPFTVLTMFNIASSFARKNPCAAICAFRQAFGDDPSVRLVVKYTNAGAFRDGVRLLREAAEHAANIVLIGDTLEWSGICALYDEASVLLSLHRSEGFGLTIAEAMLHQLPVIATNWSGNVDFLTCETGVPVGYQLVPARDPQETYEHPEMVWADPNVSEAATALRRLRADPVLRRQLGANAYAIATRLFSVRAYAESVQALIEHRRDA